MDAARDMIDVLRVLTVLGLVAANAFFVAAEYAIITARRGALGLRADAGSHRAAAALRLMDDPVRVISTVQVGVSAVSILAGAIGEPFVRSMLGDDIPVWAAFVIAFLIVTYLTVVLGELVPKALAIDRSEQLALVMAPVLELAGRILRPVIFVLQGSARAVLRVFGVTELALGETVTTAEELRRLVDDAERLGVIPEAQEELLHAVFDFADREAQDVMVAEPDVVWLEAELSPGEALDRALASRHTRFPVAIGSLDRVIGIVHIRDLLTVVPAASQGTITSLARAPFIVPETKDLGALLREMRERHEQLAIVLDEYGRTTGIVTLEDILEEIVGEIEDEYGLTEEELHRIGDSVVEVSGSMTIDDFNEAVGTQLPQPGVRTLAGLVFWKLGRLPVVGDVANVGDAELRVHALDGARIAALRVTLPRDGDSRPARPQPR